jgi:hypothetical protein
MSTILNDVQTLLSQAAAADEKIKVDAMAEYRALLASGDGDAKRLTKLLSILGKSVGDAQTDAAVIAKAKALEAVAVVPDELPAQISAANKALSDYNTETGNIIEARAARQGQLQGEVHRLNAQRERALENRSKLTVLRRQNHLLFGCEPPVDWRSQGASSRSATVLDHPTGEHAQVFHHRPVEAK